MKLIELTAPHLPVNPTFLDGPAGEECAKQIMETVPFVMRSIRAEMRSAAQGLFTVPQFRILNRLSKAPHTNRDLAEWMGVTPPTMSRMIDTLVRRGFIEKTPDPTDLRSQSLSVTALGRKETTQTRSVVRRRIANRVSGLDQRKVATLMKSLEVLRESFV
jgi:DNA-binding MarR family transcriptional regulator